MKKFCIILLLCPLCIFGQTTELNTANEIDKQILSWLQKLNTFYNTDFSAYSTSGKTRAEPGTGILINHDQLYRYKQQLNFNEFKSLIQVIVGHEFVHMLQFQRYREIALDKLTLEECRVLEAQADLLAAKMLNDDYLPARIASIEKDFDANRNVNLSAEGITKGHLASLEACNTFYFIGENSFPSGDHPSRTQRYNCAFFGFILSEAGYVNYFVEKYKNVSEAEKEEMQYHLLPVVRDGFYKIAAYTPDMDLLDWSLNMAKAICHYSSKSCYNVIATRLSMTPSRSGNIQSWDYKYNFKNTSSRKIHGLVHFRVQAFTDYKKDISHYVVLGGESRDLTLNPGESMDINGTLNYSDMQNTVGLPGSFTDTFAVYSYEYEGDRIFAHSGKDATVHRQLKVQSEGPDGQLLNYIIKLANNLADKTYENIVSGPGHPLRESIIYDCEIPSGVGSIKYARLHKQEKVGRSFIAVQICRSDDEAAVYQQYQSVKSTFTKYFTSNGVVPVFSAEENGTEEVTIKDGENGTEITIEFYKNKERPDGSKGLSIRISELR